MACTPVSSPQEPLSFNKLVLYVEIRKIENHLFPRGLCCQRVDILWFFFFFLKKVKLRKNINIPNFTRHEV